jgi:hypothetical protein
MILRQFDSLEYRRIVRRATDHVTHFGTALVHQIRIVLSQGRHRLISRFSISDFSLVVNR